MQLTLKQEDIEQAIRNHVKHQEGVTREISQMAFTMGRGPNGTGLQVNIEFDVIPVTAGNSIPSTIGETIKKDIHPDLEEDLFNAD